VPSAAAPEPGHEEGHPWAGCSYFTLDAQGTPACDDPSTLSEAGPAPLQAASVQADSGFPETCKRTVDVVIVGIEDWNRLAGALATDPSPCAEYWISIPPQSGDKTQLRMPRFFQQIRNLGPRFHPIAEMTLGTPTGWAAWVERENKTWFDAGVEFRRRMQQVGLDPGRQETWLVNEFDRSTRRDTTVRDAVEVRHNLTRAYPRAAMRDLVRGLYHGDGTGPILPGAAEIGISFTHQNLPDVHAYKEEMKAWLEDSAFWADMDLYVRWLLKEVYADTRTHSVPGSLLSQREHHLRDYQQHVLNLAKAGESRAEEALAFLRRTHTPLLNGGWEALGGDAFDFVTAHGNTQVSPEQEMHFVSEQVLAASKFTGLDQKNGARIAFDWQPENRAGRPGPVFIDALNQISARIASAIHHSYPEGKAEQDAACGPPGSGENWCQAEREGAVFRDDWKIFKEWD
jgi:hypothetical protein